ncbi:MAG: hypothetical protein ACLP8Y_04180 [Thermoplasmata archaeon]
MVGNPVVTGVLVAVGAIVFAVGILSLPICAEGLSLVLFGAGILIFVGAAWPAGGPQVTTVGVIIALVLVAFGFYIGYGSGCALFASI